MATIRKIFGWSPEEWEAMADMEKLITIGSVEQSDTNKDDDRAYIVKRYVEVEGFTLEQKLFMAMVSGSVLEKLKQENQPTASIRIIGVGDMLIGVGDMPPELKSLLKRLEEDSDDLPETPPKTPEQLKAEVDRLRGRAKLHPKKPEGVTPHGA